MHRPASLLVIALLSCSLGCAAPQPEELHSGGDELPCVPNETRCESETRVSTCARDGLSRTTALCDEGSVCLSPRPGGRCGPLPANTTTIERNFDATVRLAMPDDAYCTAFLVNDDTVLTNHHCCPGADDCVGEGFHVEVRYRGVDGSIEDLYEEAFGIVAQRMNDASLDAVALQLDRPAGRTYGHVILARSRAFVGSAVYVTGHPRGRPLESSLGLVYGYRDEVTYRYTSQTKVKRFQMLYGARAEPGSSGSPVFLVSTHALVALHHTGGLSSAAVGLTEEQTSGFDRLLGATDAEALAEALELHGIEFEELAVDR